MSNNTLELTGRIQSAPVPHHEAYGRRFFGFTLAVRRLSGYEDMLPVITDARRIMALEEGARVSVKGELRSYTLLTEAARHLSILAFSHSAEHTDEAEDNNALRLQGRLLRAPVYRFTPQGREIADMLLIVERTHNKRDALPLIAWGRNARLAQTLSAGQHIIAEGRFQSRPYQKALETGEETRVAYEVSVGELNITSCPG